LLNERVLFYEEEYRRRISYRFAYIRISMLSGVLINKIV